MFKKQKAQVANTLKDVHGALDDHLEAINTNTLEVCENRTMILELQERICKLSDQVAQLQEVAGALPERFREPIVLEADEQEVFLLLYTASTPLSYSNIARTIRRPVVSVQDIVYALISKQIPVIKQRREHGDVFLSLDIEFQELQSKQKIVHIDSNLQTKWNMDLQTSLFDK